MEARSYGLAVLATGGAAARAGPLAAGAPARACCCSASPAPGMGLAHWYAVTVLAAFVVAALLLRGRRALPGWRSPGLRGRCRPSRWSRLNLLNGTGGRNAEHLRDTGGQLAGLAVEAWAGGRTPLLYLTVGLAVVGAVRARGRPGGRPSPGCSSRCCCCVAAELVRPVYLPRYLLAGLLGLGVLAAAGALAAAARRPRCRSPSCWSGCSLLAPRAAGSSGARGSAADERGRPAWPRCTGAGEPVVAADQRSAIGAGPLRPRPRPPSCAPTSSCRRTTRPPTPTGCGWSAG